MYFFLFKIYQCLRTEKETKLEAAVKPRMIAGFKTLIFGKNMVKIRLRERTTSLAGYDDTRYKMESHQLKPDPPKDLEIK